MESGLVQEHIVPKRVPKVLAPIKCGIRKVGKSSSGARTTNVGYDAVEGTSGRNEMDSMADTSCAGSTGG